MIYVLYNYLFKRLYLCLRPTKIDLHIHFFVSNVSGDTIFVINTGKMR